MTPSERDAIAVVARVIKIIDQTPTHDETTDKQFRAYRFKKTVIERIARHLDELTGGSVVRDSGIDPDLRER